MNQKTYDQGLVILSGGQDSTTCLGVALHECEKVHAITFTYNQRHAIEVEAAAKIGIKHGVSSHRIMDLSVAFAHMSSSALLNTTDDLSTPHTLVRDAPASFVPARNALFLTVAFGVALEHGMDVLYAGMSQTDYSGYPDCREIFIAELICALNIGYESQICIRTPLMYRTKAETFALAAETGVLDTVLSDSMTCYNGETAQNLWGMGCGECPACKLRKQGWIDYVNSQNVPYDCQDSQND